MLKVLSQPCVRCRIHSRCTNFRTETDAASPLFRVICSFLQRSSVGHRAFFCSDSSDGSEQVAIARVESADGEVEDAESKSSLALFPANLRLEDNLTELGLETNDKTAFSAKWRDGLEPKGENIRLNYRINKQNPYLPFATSVRPGLRFYSSNSEPPSDESPNPAPAPNLAPSQAKDISVDVQDVSNKELKARIEKYFNEHDEEALPSILEAILQRKLAGKHEETDDELLEELRMEPLDDVKDKEFESDFEELHETDEEIDDLYNARDIVVNRMVKDEYFNMDEKKWDDIVQDGINHGFLKDTKECEEILEDMLSWDKLLPDDLKKKTEVKFNELGDMCERGELEPEEAFELYKKFEDETVMEYVKKMEAEGPPQFDETAVLDNKKDSDDPPGEGPILRWQTRVVFAPGGDAWHPKNRKVKLSVTVKELGLSKHQFRRLRELVGKRYHPGKDQLTITSERFEHREENRKDCLRTLLSLIEEAGKANKLVEDARASYVKDRLKANPAFMERLRLKAMRLRESNTVSS